MSLLSGIFSDLFARQDNCLARLDARTKLIVALSILAAVIFSTTPVLPLATLVLCVAVTAVLGVPIRLIALRLAGPMGIATMLVLLQSVMVGSTPLWSVTALGVKATVMREGLHVGVLLASRVLGGVSVMLLLGSVTPSHRIFCAMRALGAPQGWVEIALLMYRYTFVLLELTGDVTAAQKVRLGYAGLRRGLSSAGTLGGMVVLRSMDQAVRTHEAMRVRGYHGEIPLGPLPPFARCDGWLVAGSALVLGSVYLAAEALFR
jgi:cobalt/nickel transport system permease protein